MYIMYLLSHFRDIYGTRYGKIIDKVFLFLSQSKSKFKVQLFLCVSLIKITLQSIQLANAVVCLSYLNSLLELLKCILCRNAHLSPKKLIVVNANKDNSFMCGHISSSLFTSGMFRNMCFKIMSIFVSIFKLHKLVKKYISLRIVPSLAPIFE